MWAPVGPPPPTVAPPLERGPRRWPWIVLALLLAAGIGVGIYLLVQNTRVAVPDQVGKQSSVATVDLSNRGFKVQIHRAESAEPVGQVIGQSPEAGTKVDKGSLVVLQVSSGPGTAQVPLVVGLKESTATKALNRRGLNVDTSLQHSSTVPKGQVISTSPPDGTTVQKGSRVDLVISSGPVQVKVPDVTNQDTPSAHSELRNAGLTYTDNQVNATQPKGTVISQTPTGGMRAGVIRGDYDAADPRTDDCFGARWCLAVVSARLKRHVQRRVLEPSVASVPDRLNLGVRGAEGGVETLPKRFGFARHYCTGQRIGADALSPPALGQLDRASEVAAVGIGLQLHALAGA